MRFIKMTSLVCAGIIFMSFVLSGCASERDSVASPPPPPAAMPPREPEIPLRPITQEIIDKIAKSEESIKKLQYYISATITLAKEDITQKVEIKKGVGMEREISSDRQIVVDKETGGILVNTYRDKEGRTILAIGFDETNEKNMLFFREDDALSDRFLILMTDPASRAIGYGDETYRLQFDGDDIPHLLIRYSEEKNSNPDKRVVKGRLVGSD